MKIEIDKNGRRLYKFSHSAAHGGYVYVHKSINNAVIKDKEGLRNTLQVIAKKYELIDVTIKVYGTIFFLFFQSKPSLVPQQLIDTIQAETVLFSTWDEDYVWTGVYDLQEKYVRQDLERWRYDYDKG